MSLKSPVLFDEDVDTLLKHGTLAARRVSARYAGDGAKGALAAGLKAGAYTRSRQSST